MTLTPSRVARIREEASILANGFNSGCYNPDNVSRNDLANRCERFAKSVLELVNAEPILAAAEAGAWRPTREEIARTLDVRAFETVEEIGAGIHPRYGFSEKSIREYAASEQAGREPRRVKALETADAILALPAPPTAEAK